MTVSALRSHHTAATRHPQPADSKPSQWVGGLKKLVRDEADNLDHYELVGGNSADFGTAKAKAITARMPDSVKAFLKRQTDAAADNDGSPALLWFPLKEINPKLHGAAIAVRWTSEDGQLDRLFVYDRKGKEVAKAWTDTGANFHWQLARGPFQIDDSPHRA